MADVVSPAVRSRMMSGIKAKNTQPEILVRRMLFASGYRFRLHRRDLPGTPDIVMPGRKIAIFVHGCFWHFHSRCRFAKMPTTRADFWVPKLESNAVRDKRTTAKLQEMGWRVLVVWECATRGNDAAAALQDAMSRWIEGSDPMGEMGGMAQT